MAPAAAADRALVAEGRLNFVRYCASCHGVNADGRGPVAKALAAPPPDLRRLGTQFGAPPSADKIASYIDGRAAVAAHGDREMPVWGERFNDIAAEGPAREAAVKARMAGLVAYLESIQTAPAR